jgi:transcriptional regulator with XRE-family HTH domain
MATPHLEPWTARQLLIPQRLRARRCELGLTQKQVVTRLARCGVRTTNRALSSMEHGAGIDIAKLPAVAIALDCTVTYLIGLTDDPARWEPDRQPDPPAASARAVPRAGSDECSLILGGEVPERGRSYDFRAILAQDGWSSA